MSSHVLVIGAASGIGAALCRVFAEQGQSVILAGRDRAELDRSATDLTLRYGVPAYVEVCDALAYDTHPTFVQRCADHAPNGIESAVICVGRMADQRDTETDFHVAREVIDSNFTAPASLLNALADLFERQGGGSLAAIASVAGDRGRGSNYTYGSAKAALATYLEGMRNRLKRSGVHVLCIKPGFTDTRMTAGIVNPNSPLLASPECVARDIARALHKRRSVLYTPWYWGGIMTIIRAIPGFIFNRMKL